MNRKEFQAWRKEMGYSQIEAAEALGLSKATIENYERGYRLDKRQEVEIPLTVQLACEALLDRAAKPPQTITRMKIQMMFNGEQHASSIFNMREPQDIVSKLDHLFDNLELNDQDFLIRDSMITISPTHKDDRGD